MFESHLSKCVVYPSGASLDFTELLSQRRQSLEEPTSDLQGAPLQLCSLAGGVSSTVIFRVPSIFKVKDIRVLESTYIRIKATKRFLERRKPLQPSPMQHTIIVVLDHVRHWTPATMDLRTGAIEPLRQPSGDHSRTHPGSTSFSRTVSRPARQAQRETFAYHMTFRSRVRGSPY